MLSKKGIDSVEDLEHLPDNMRQYLAMQAMQEGKPFPPHLMRPGQQPVSYGNGSLLMGGDNNSGKVGE